MSRQIFSKREELRRQAEAIIESGQGFSQSFDLNEIKKIFHELQVYQIELEMQNDELLRVQEELEKSQKRFEHLYNHAPLGYLILDSAGIIQQSNFTFREMVAQSELSKIPLADLLLPEDAAIFRARYRNFFANPLGKSMELCFCRSDQSTFYGILSARLQKESFLGNESHPQILISVSDISEKHEIQTRISMEQERLSVILSSISDGVITTDLFGRVASVNPAALKILEKEKEAILAKPFFEICPLLDGDTKNACENLIQQVLEFNRPCRFLCAHQILRLPTSEKQIDCSASPMHHKDGTICGVVLTIRDITERTRFLEQLQNTEKLNSLGVLARGIAHDFNNLLGILFGYLELMQDTKITPQTKECLDGAFCVFERAKNLTQQLLVFSKGGAAPSKKSLDITKLIEKEVPFVLSGTSIHLDLQLETPLWPCIFDENQISRVLDNLVINAMQSMPAHGKILISARNLQVSSGMIPGLIAGKYVEISLQDGGCGIAPEHQSKIFDPFFTTKDSGSGLGLSVCFAILEKHGGKILLKSSSEQGSCFSFYLPADISFCSISTPPSQFQHQGQGRILIMDDEPSLLQVCARMLQSLGYETIGCACGEEAISLFQDYLDKNESFTSVILDLTIPGKMGGVEAAKQIRKLCPHILIFASSGYCHDPVMAEPGNFCFDDSLPKPYMKKDLIELFNRHLKHS